MLFCVGVCISKSGHADDTVTILAVATKEVTLDHTTRMDVTPSKSSPYGDIIFSIVLSQLWSTFYGQYCILHTKVRYMYDMPRTRLE